MLFFRLVSPLYLQTYLTNNGPMSLSSSSNSSTPIPPEAKNSVEAVQELIPSNGRASSSVVNQDPQLQINPDPSASLPSDWQYESAVDKVEAIIQDIEGGELELADIFDQFSIAVQELHACESFLQHHRHQVELLVETLANEPQA